MSTAVRDALGRVDAAIYRVERRVVGSSLVAMAGAVFLDVVHRVFSRSPGRFSLFLGDVLGRSPERLDATVTPILMILATWGVAYVAFRTRQPSPGASPLARRPAMVRAALATVALVALVQGFVRGVPQGVVWAPYFALCLFLWVGLVGASMATYAGRHLALEMGEKLWPIKLQPKVRAFSQLVAGGFALLLAILGGMSMADHLSLWIDTPQASLIPAVDIPKWLVFLVVPYAFGAIALRFMGYASGLLPTPPPEPEFEMEDAQ